MSGSRASFLVLGWLCLSAACERQFDLVALRETAKSCDASGTCPKPPINDAGRAPEPDCDATNTCMRPAPDSGPEQEPEPPCPGAPTCPPPPQVIERCETRACAATARSDMFCASDGLVVALGDGCANADSNPEFRYALCSREALIVKAPLQVNGDVAVDGNVIVSADITIEGDLRYGGMIQQNEGSDPQARSTMQAPPTCTLPEALRTDVGASVQARATDNDNDRAGDQLALLSRSTGQQTITLPCGRYHLSEIDGDDLIVNAMGHVALYVDGSVSIRQRLEIRAAPSARVSLLVNDSVHVIGGLKLGDLSDARHLLLAANQIHLERGENTIGGVLYSQNQDILLVMGTLDVNGAVFAARAQLEGATSVTHVGSAASAGESCKPEP